MPFLNGGHIWIVLILVGVLVIFGPGKLPELGSAVGRTIREFKKSTEGLREEITAHHDSQPQPAAAAAVTPVTPAGPATTAPAAVTPVETKTGAAATAVATEPRA